ncbi:alpha-crystallin domain-containing protein 22.3 [Citrus sinensis]|uniref:Alpha-crystallin domain-containing protein 22.3 n=1 Tax=Citrus sinensis TaxID=2711 RepID=A0ACB8KKQ5_CITSI|nr:alpha-crystallin domain-containing protein 22.3 [Citrus sinensis]
MPPVKIRIVEENEDEMDGITVQFEDQIRIIPFGKTTEIDEPEHDNPQQHVLDVAPLNSMPYIGPPTPPSDFGSTSRKQETEAAENVGPAMVGTGIGAVDIAESDDSYAFRVALPGVARDEKDFTCDIDPDGKVTIKGVTTTGEKTVCKQNQVFKMLTQNLSPPGHFSISFKLPGPVNTEDFTGKFGTDGMLEGLVKKSVA